MVMVQPIEELNQLQMVEVWWCLCGGIESNSKGWKDDGDVPPAYKIKMEDGDGTTCGEMLEKIYSSTL